MKDILTIRQEFISRNYQDIQKRIKEFKKIYPQLAEHGIFCLYDDKNQKIRNLLDRWINEYLVQVKENIKKTNSAEAFSLLKLYPSRSRIQIDPQAYLNFYNLTVLEIEELIMDFLDHANLVVEIEK